MEQTLDISWKTIFKALIAGSTLYVIFLAREIAVAFFFAIIISLLVEPVISFLRRLRLPKVLSVILVYVLIFGIFGLTIYLITPILIFEISQLSKNIPDYFDKLNPILKSLGFGITQNFEDFTSNLVPVLQESSKNIIKSLYVFFGGIASTILIFTFAFYISLEEKGVEKILSLLAPKKYEEYIETIFQKAQFKVAGWFWARILACLFVGVASFIVFFIFDIKYTFILALTSGVLNFIPFVGPVITAALIILFVGVSSSWVTALYIVIAFYIIQVVENSLITPVLMNKFLDLPPILVLISILIGGTMFGILGIIFVVPVSGIIYEFVLSFSAK